MRQEQVLGQAPVEEQADPVDLHHLEAGEAADLHLGLEDGSHRAVFAVQVEEHVEPVAHLGRLVLGHIALGQEDFAVRAAVQVQAEVGVLGYLQ
ncbi:hypothetical protein D3C71_2025080 [compost metagenome]